MTPQREMSARSRTPAGFTLMEVLVACGILVFGLASIAAILPAAGSRMAQAGVEDRAAALAANAWADIQARRLTDASLYGGTIKPVFFGPPALESAMTLAPNLPANTPPAARWFLTPGSAFNARFDRTRDIWSQDELEYTPSTGPVPLNRFFSGGAGPREFRPKVCWAGMMMPDPTRSGGSIPNAAPGVSATMSIFVMSSEPKTDDALAAVTLYAPVAVIENPPGTKIFLAPSGSFALGQIGTPMASADREAAERIRRAYFAPGSWVMLLPTLPGGDVVRLMMVNASWMLPSSPASATSGTWQPQIALRMPPDVTADLTAANEGPYRRLQPNSTNPTWQEITVVGVKNLVRVEQHKVRLQ